MIIKFNESEISLLNSKLRECEKILKVRYPYKTSILMIALLLIILFMVYIGETNDNRLVTFISALLTVAPLWVIISSPVFYFQKWLPAKKGFKFFNNNLNNGAYEAIHVRADKCEQYATNGWQYYAFHLNTIQRLLLRANDFEVDDNFPSSDFIIPPFNLSYIIGNRIISNGEIIEPIKAESLLILKYYRTLDLFEKGRVLFVNDK